VFSHVDFPSEVCHESYSKIRGSQVYSSQKKASFTIEEAKISGIKAKRSKKSSACTLEFAVTCAPASEHQLAQIVECYLKTRYFIFAEATPDLFSESRAAQRKAGRADADGRAAAAGEETAAASTH